MNEPQSPRWRRRPKSSTWGDFGVDDALGRINLLTGAKVAEGLAEVREGRAFALGLPLTLPGGNALNANRLPPVRRPTLRQGHAGANVIMDPLSPGSSDVLSDDLVVLHNQYSTQWDAFAHVGSMFDADGDGVPEPVYYNGFRAGVEVIGPTDPADCGVPGPGQHTTSDLGPVGIGTLAAHPVQGRAVMIDLAHHLGTEHRVVDFEALRGVIEADGVDVRPGDIVTLHTGYAAKVLEMAGDPDPEVLHHYGAVLDGRDQALLDWITDSGIAAIAADNYAVELYPATPTEAPASILPLHEHCLFKLGVPLGELWHLSELATALRTAGRTAYLLTAPPLNLPGASGSPLNPIATI
ncbi:cyclase family protein [Citricoccus sp. I39-566]|uniref:cyclase family protein n=1 Tax=Citricoccus sp. I39-566 TaxID=3073268 RepID=UPI00286C7763|nr:cyclase family protein [Citricoccus sp. I39-566]WMY78988.1 cyclase family protein [Citricoccus sp. I39-566]